MKHSNYFNYIEKHRLNVKRAWIEILRPVLSSWGQDKNQLDIIDKLVECHDESKFSPDEFSPYEAFYYNGESREKSGIDAAWLHHQNANPHHWQYWVLMPDSRTDVIKPLDMPFEYICEMLCDWASFQFDNEGNTARSWYQLHKHTMLLSQKTRITVEELLKLCPGL